MTGHFFKPNTELDRHTLGKYELLCRLSTGGMSEIFLATQKGLAGFRKIVALKSILPDVRGEEELVRMFLEEARITSSFNHPHIAQVFDLDTDDGKLFLAMEFVQGATLYELIEAYRARSEEMPLGFTIRAVRDTALALHYAHTFCDSRGRPLRVIHRDVSGKNVMVTYEGTAKLLDFGIAKSLGRLEGNTTSVGMVKGTSGYMSPEQALGEPLDPRTDVFSLGVVLHEGLTGRRLFARGSPLEEMRAVLEPAPPPSHWNPQISEAMDQVTLKALSPARDQRYGTALELARAIEAAVEGALWNPEQLGERVQRLYADRLSQTQSLVKQAQGGTGEHSGLHREASTDLAVAYVPREADRPTGERPTAELVPRPLASPSPSPVETQDDEPTSPSMDLGAMRTPTRSMRAPSIENLPPVPEESAVTRPEGIDRRSQPKFRQPAPEIPLSAPTEPAVRAIVREPPTDLMEGAIVDTLRDRTAVPAVAPRRRSRTVPLVLALLAVAAAGVGYTLYGDSLWAAQAVEAPPMIDARVAAPQVEIEPVPVIADAPKPVEPPPSEPPATVTEPAKKPLKKPAKKRTR